MHSLSAGLTTQKWDGANCDAADKVGFNRQSKMDSVPYNEAKLKRSAQIEPLQDIQPGVKVGKKVIELILFYLVDALLYPNESVKTWHRISNGI